MEAMHDDRSGVDQGLLSRWLDAGTGLAHKGIEQGFGLARDVHGEVGKGVVAALDWVEITQRVFLGIARHMQTRSSALFDAVLEAGEQSSRAVVVGARATGQGATRLVSHTAAVLSASPPPN